MISRTHPASHWYRAACIMIGSLLITSCATAGRPRAQTYSIAFEHFPASEATRIARTLERQSRRPKRLEDFRGGNGYLEISLTTAESASVVHGHLASAIRRSGLSQNAVSISVSGAGRSFVVLRLAPATSGR